MNKSLDEYASKSAETYTKAAADTNAHTETIKQETAALMSGGIPALNAFKEAQGLVNRANEEYAKLQVENEALAKATALAEKDYATAATFSGQVAQKKAELAKAGTEDERREIEQAIIALQNEANGWTASGNAATVASRAKVAGARAATQAIVEETNAMAAQKDERLRKSVETSQEEVDALSNAAPGKARRAVERHFQAQRNAEASSTTTRAAVNPDGSAVLDKDGKPIFKTSVTPEDVQLEEKKLDLDAKRGDLLADHPARAKTPRAGGGGGGALAAQKDADRVQMQDMHQDDQVDKLEEREKDRLNVLKEQTKELQLGKGANAEQLNIMKAKQSVDREIDQLNRTANENATKMTLHINEQVAAIRQREASIKDPAERAKAEENITKLMQQQQTIAHGISDAKRTELESMAEQIGKQETLNKQLEQARQIMDKVHPEKKFDEEYNTLKNNPTVSDADKKIALSDMQQQNKASILGTSDPRIAAGEKIRKIQEAAADPDSGITKQEATTAQLKVQKDLQDQLISQGKAIGVNWDNIGDNITKLASGTETWKQALKSVIGDFDKQFMKMGMNAISGSSTGTGINGFLNSLIGINTSPTMAGGTSTSSSLGGAAGGKAMGMIGSNASSVGSAAGGGGGGFLSSIGSWISGLFGGGSGGGAAASAFASGGVAPGDAMSLVGENGPELIMPENNTRVINNSQTQDILGGNGGNKKGAGGGDIHMHFHGVTDVPAMKASQHQIRSAVARTVKQARS